MREPADAPANPVTLPTRRDALRTSLQALASMIEGHLQPAPAPAQEAGERQNPRP